MSKEQLSSDPEFSGMPSGTFIAENIIDYDPELNRLQASSIAVLPTRGRVLFPGQAVPLPIGREKSLQLLKNAAENNKFIFAVAQKDAEVEEPTSKDVFRVGVVCKVIKLVEMPDGNQTAFLLTLCRAKVMHYCGSKPFITAKVIRYDETMPAKFDVEMYATVETIKELYGKMLSCLGEEERNDLEFAVKQIDSNKRLLNFLCMQVPNDYTRQQQMLEEDSFSERMVMLIRELSMQIQYLEVRQELHQRTQEEISQAQRQNYLEQQMRLIQNELQGDEDDIAALSQRVSQLTWDAAMNERFDKELRRLERYNPQSPDYAIQYAYLDTLLSLPWQNYSEDSFSLDDVETILNRDHYGLRDVKDRIIEQMAVLKQRGDVKAGILCLYGPPGVGKTSLGKSIAEAMGREYVRVSFGGLHDESEIRGHRRTYLGAMPGRIISGLQKCKTSNPVFVLDEIDKIGNDYKGDPAMALLEVLDPEQNEHFHDNYIDVDYDLSKVLFIATANSLSTISYPLLDRMELIEITGYITEEKIEIAQRHLIDKKLAECGLEKGEVKFDNAALERIITEYTRESGVRQLDKKIAKVLRKIVRLKVSGKPYPTVVTDADIPQFLGKREVFSDIYENNDYCGVVTGLAWTSAGGEILFIESSLCPGKGEKLSLTGNLGDVMKESATIALQYLRANADKLGIDAKMFSTNDIHIHVPEGAVPKDGPSAGITMVTSLASAFSRRKVRDRLAMTGEITLRGKVLPVGGIKEKILAAKRAGITDIMLCEQNRKDIEDIDPMYVEGLTFHYVENIGQVLDFALLPATDVDDK